MNVFEKILKNKPLNQDDQDFLIRLSLGFDKPMPKHACKRCYLIRVVKDAKNEKEKFTGREIED